MGLVKTGSLKVVADQTPFAGLHGPVYVPKKLEDEGNRGYGAFGCTASSSWIFPTQHIKRRSDVLSPLRNIPEWVSPSTRFTVASWSADSSPQRRNYQLRLQPDLSPQLGGRYRDEEHPVPVAQLPRPVPPPEAPYRDFCFKRGRFGAHNPPHLKAPGKPRQEFIAYSYFIAGLRCYDIGDLYKPVEVAYFIPPQGGDLE